MSDELPDCSTPQQGTAIMAKAAASCNQRGARRVLRSHCQYAVFAWLFNRCVAMYSADGVRPTGEYGKAGVARRASSASWTVSTLRCREYECAADQIPKAARHQANSVPEKKIIASRPSALIDSTRRSSGSCLACNGSTPSAGWSKYITLTTRR